MLVPQRVDGFRGGGGKRVLAGELVEVEVAEPGGAALVRLEAAVETPRKSGQAAAITAFAGARRREGNARPRPACGRGSVCELVLEHLAHRADGPAVSGVRIPGDQRVDEGRVQEGRVVLPVDALQRLAVEDRIVEEHLRPRRRIPWQAAFDEMAAVAPDVVV